VHVTGKVLSLDEWVEAEGLVGLKNQWLCHAEQFIEEEDARRGLVRLMFISLRQEIDKPLPGQGQLRQAMKVVEAARRVFNKDLDNQDVCEGLVNPLNEMGYR
jgi:hypothetical protein